MSTLSILNSILEAVARVTGQRKEIKSLRVEEERVKLSPLTHEMTESINTSKLNKRRIKSTQNSVKYQDTSWHSKDQ